jgi:hypothetical protein
MARQAKKTEIPFDFVLEELFSVSPVVRPMFGSHSIYLNDKIVLILRRREAYEYDNGVWLATSREHHESLKKDFPSMRSIRLFGGSESEWQNLPFDSEDFEEAVMRACRLILKGDPRIGKIPTRRRVTKHSNSKR